MKIEYVDRESGNIITEKPPGEIYLDFLYNKKIGRFFLNSLVKKPWLSTLYGKRMDQPNSIKKIQSFVDKLGIDMSESVKNINEFTSFNDFFYRKLKPSARPISSGIISPGDGKLTAFNNISELTNFFVKGKDFTVAKFLGDQDLAHRYKDGSIFILRLAPNDYHRYHFPLDGIAKPSMKINGHYMSVSPYALRDNFAQVFIENKREYTLLETKEKGTVCIAPVGATMVGSIISTYDPNTTIEKGDEMGYFAFGGSTIVLLFEKGTIIIDKDLLDNTDQGLETGVKMGMRIGL